MERLTMRKGKVVCCSAFEKGECHFEYCEQCDHEAEAWSKLAEYEDLEEQGLIIKLPCKVGNTIYRINQYAKEPIISMKVLQIRYGELSRGNTFFRVDAINDEDMGESCYFKDDFGKTVFLTHTEAEQALARMEKKHE